MRADRLLRLYPRRWRDRYADEFLAIVGSERLRVQQVIDVVSGAIDAWLSPDVWRATGAARAAAERGGPMPPKSVLACYRARTPYTVRDALVAAAVMIVGTLAFRLLGAAAGRAGWPATRAVATQFGFLAAFALSMPLWVMKGQPWKAQAAIVGATLVLLAAIGYLG